MLNINNSIKLMKSIGFTEVLLSDYKKDFESKTFQASESFEATKKIIMSLNDVDDNLIKKFAVYKIGEKLVYVRAWTLFKTVEDKIEYIKGCIEYLKSVLLKKQFDELSEESVKYFLEMENKNLKELTESI